MTDVRELLTNAAASPTSELDVDAVVGTARRRRRTRIGMAAGCVVAVAAIAGGLSLRIDSSSVNVAIAPRQEGSTVPAGWTELKLPDAGLRLAIPPGWTQLAQYAPPSVPARDGTPTVSETVVVGSSGHPRTGEISGCSELGQTPVALGTWVSLYEAQGYEPGSDLVLPAGERLPAGAILDRPIDFRTVGGTQGSCGSGSSSTGNSETLASYEVVAFRDAGRLFLARIVTTADPNRDGIGVGNEVLNTLVVEPSQTTETPKVSVVTTFPRPTVTTQAPTSSTETPEEAAVRTAFLAWINAQPKDGLDEFVEDFASIQDSLRQGMAQHSASDLTKYSGRVDSVQIVDETHASVVYSVLFNDAPEFSQRPGVAIKIDGVWKVSRDTVCDLLTLGGITCPPRSGA